MKYSWSLVVVLVSILPVGCDSSQQAANLASDATEDQIKEYNRMRQESEDKMRLQTQ